MTDEQMEKLAQKLADKINASPCKCGLSEANFKRHEEDHVFIRDVRSGLGLVHKAGILAIVSSITSAILFILWIGFKMVIGK